MPQTRRKYFVSVREMNQQQNQNSWSSGTSFNAEFGFQDFPQLVTPVANGTLRLNWQIGCRQLEEKGLERQTTRLGYWCISLGEWELELVVCAYYLKLNSYRDIIFQTFWVLRPQLSGELNGFIVPDGYLKIHSRLSIANIYFQEVTTMRLGKLGLQHKWRCTGIGNALELGMQQRFERWK